MFFPFTKYDKPNAVGLLARSLNYTDETALIGPRLLEPGSALRGACNLRRRPPFGSLSMFFAARREQ